MKVLFIVILLSLSTISLASKNDPREYIFYQTDAHYGDKEISYAYYRLKSDPCIYFRSFQSHKTIQYCTLGDNGVDLRKSDISLKRVSDYGLGELSFFYTDANEVTKHCEINSDKNTIKCLTKKQIYNKLR